MKIRTSNAHVITIAGRIYQRWNRVMGHWVNSFGRVGSRIIIIIIIIHSFYRAMCQQIQLKTVGVESQAQFIIWNLCCRELCRLQVVRNSWQRGQSVDPVLSLVYTSCSSLQHSRIHVHALMCTTVLG